jgi:hypothetical protein
MTIHLKPFDPSRDFIAYVDMTCRGRSYDRGDPFEKTTVPHRTLRILYEGRSIGYPEDFKPVIPIRARRVDSRDGLMAMAKNELVAELKRRNVAIDRRWSKAQLVEEVARFAHAAHR